jgi:hypothetical protein
LDVEVLDVGVFDELCAAVNDVSVTATTNASRKLVFFIGEALPGLLEVLVSCAGSVYLHVSTGCTVAATGWQPKGTLVACVLEGYWTVRAWLLPCL